MSAKKPGNEFDPFLFNAANPITGMTIYPKGSVEIHRKNLLQGEHRRGQRGKIKVFSKVSRERLAMTAKESQVDFCTMITITYGVNHPHDGLTVKRHLKKFLRGMRKFFGRYDYLWFFEFQARGAPHIHIMTNLPEPSSVDRCTMSSIWVDDCQDLRNWEYSKLSDRSVLMVRDASLWFHARDEAWEKIRSKDGAARYTVKYALKMRQKVAPDWFGDVGRFWGCSRFVKLPNGTRFKMTEDSARRILKEHCPRLDDADVLPRFVYDCFT